MRELEIEALRDRIAPLTTEAREVEREGAAPALASKPATVPLSPRSANCGRSELRSIAVVGELVGKKRSYT